MAKNIYKKFLILFVVLFFSNQSYSEKILEGKIMYKDQDKDSAEFIKQKNTLIVKATHTFGTREHASEGYTEKGFDHFSTGEFNSSIKRFNQAWLLNPENPYPYLGFGLLLNNNDNSCEAYNMFKLANEKGLSENGFLADYAHTISKCALDKDEHQQKALFETSNDLHEQASNTSNKRLLAYVYHSWAKSYLLQKNFSKTKEMIESSKSLGGKIDNSLLEAIENHNSN